MGTSLLQSAVPVANGLEGKVALITGGASGLRAVTAKLFHEHGTKVLIADNRSYQGQPSSEDVSFVHCDVTNESPVQSAVEKAVSMHGKLDTMFNKYNAGIMTSMASDILNYDHTDFEHVLRVNITGVFLGTKHAAHVMKRARQGSIINTASVCSIISGAATHAYTSSKHAVLRLTRNTAVELGQYGIRVNCVLPYVVPSSMARKILSREEDDPMADINSNRKGVSLKPEDVAQAIVYLASDESRYVSGHNLVLGGGFTVMNSGLTMFDR